MSQSCAHTKTAIFPRMTAALFAVILALTICTPFAYAAAPAKYSDAKTIDEKIAWMKETYAITDFWPWLPEIVGTTGKQIELQAIDRLANAWSLVGTSTTQKIFSHILKELVTSTDDFTLALDDPNYVGSYNIAGNTNEVTISIGISYNGGYVATTRDMVAVVMMSYDLGILSNKGSTAIAKINGVYSGYTNANQYVNNYSGTTTGSADFGETAADMIVRGGDSPCTLGKDTKLYKKYVACYELLLESFGVKSNAVIRSAAFLGIELPKE